MTGVEPQSQEESITKILADEAKADAAINDYRNGYDHGFQKGKVENSIMANRVAILINQAYNEGKAERRNDEAEILLELPDKIEAQSKTVASLTCQIEKLRLEINQCKMQALDTVCMVTEAGKPKYSNDTARRAAQEKLLQESGKYTDACDALGRLEMQVRDAQIELDYQQNLFRAHLAIAGNQGVR